MKKLTLIITIVFSGMLMQAQMYSSFAKTSDYSGHIIFDEAKNILYFIPLCLDCEKELKGIENIALHLTNGKSITSYFKYPNYRRKLNVAKDGYMFTFLIYAWEITLKEIEINDIKYVSLYKKGREDAKFINFIKADPIYERFISTINNQTK